MSMPAIGLHQFAGGARRRRAGAEGELARIGLGVGDQLLHVVGRHRRMADQRQRDGAELGDRLEIGDRVVGHALEHALVGGMRGVGGDEHRVAVGRRRAPRSSPPGCRCRRRCSRPSPSGRAKSDMAAEQPRERVGRAAGRERHDELDAAARIALLRRRGCGDRAQAPSAAGPAIVSTGVSFMLIPLRRRPRLSICSGDVAAAGTTATCRDRRGRGSH